MKSLKITSKKNSNGKSLKITLKPVQKVIPSKNGQGGYLVKKNSTKKYG